MQRTKAVSRVHEIVGLAQQADVPSVSRTTPCEGRDVIELEKRPRVAAPAICGNERALTVISSVRFSPHDHGHVTSALACRCYARRARRRFACL